MNLWERTKSVAKLYTGTFIIVMILNQLVFFGFCLNPICLVAAMPHVLLITVFVGSWINKQFGWGDDEQTRKEQYNAADFERPESNYFEISETKDPENIVDYSACKTCGAKTILRTAKVGKYAGKDFYGCSRYPKCKGITNIE